MSVTGKTLGIILIGLVGLLAYDGVYIASALGVASVAYAATYVGVALTAVMLLIVVTLATGQES
jgi:uncharacterized membrane protein YuzA (DUF378 family)